MPSKPTGLSRRWEMLFMMTSGVLIVYTLRVNMSVAAQKMRTDLGWSESEKGYVLSAFYWGYALGQIPAARFAQIYGAKWLFGMSVLIPSVLTLLVPVACRHSFGMALFIRCILGFFESASFPAVYHFFPHWIPIEEKTVMVTVLMSGMYMGEIVGFSLSGLLVATPQTMIGSLDVGGWSSVFYVFGAIGVIWFPYWALMAYETPECHPYITADELNLMRKGKHYAPLVASFSGDDKLLHHQHNHQTYSANNHDNNDYEFVRSADDIDNMGVVQGITHITLVDHHSHTHSDSTSGGHGHHMTTLSDDSSSDHNSRTPWAAIFTNKASLTLLQANWTYGFIGFMLLSEMPSYLTDELNFSLKDAGLLCVIPYACLFVMSLLMGRIFDYLQLHRSWTTRTVRQWAQFIALGGAAGMLLLCGFMDNKWVGFVFMTIGQTLLGASGSGLGCAYLDIAPKYSSMINTIGNTIGAMAGILGPILVAQCIAAYPGILGWRIVFFITCAMSAVSLTFWALYQTSDIVEVLNTPRPRNLNK